MQKYSQNFESKVALYVTGDPNDRSDKVMHELYTKLSHADSFFDFCKQYIDLNGKRFMEIGCGTGYVSAAVARRGGQVCATDFVSRACELTQMRFAEHELECEVFGSDVREAFPRKFIGIFDFVFCFQVLEHIPRGDHFTALHNVFELVAPGGYCFIDTENSLCPYDRHDTNSWLLRLLSKQTAERLIEKLGFGLNFFEPSIGSAVQTRDYLSFDELFGAARIAGFEVVDPFVPHGDKRQYLRTITGSDWLHDEILKYFDIERFSPISVLLKRAIT